LQQVERARSGSANGSVMSGQQNPSLVSIQGPDSTRGHENELAKRRRIERERLEQLEEIERLQKQGKSQLIIQQVSKSRSGSVSRPEEISLSNQKFDVGRVETEEN